MKSLRRMRLVVVVVGANACAACTKLFDVDFDGHPLTTGASVDAGTAAGTGPDRTWALWSVPDRQYVTPLEHDGDEVVVDSTTALEWAIEPIATPVVGTDLAKACAESRIGSFTDWRPPTRIELLSIVDYGRELPAADTIIVIRSYSYWTSSDYFETPGTGWIVDFTNGSVVTQQRNTAAALRCVRGGHDGIKGGPADRYEVANGGLVFDKITNLTWLSDTASERNQVGARAYCDLLEVGGKADFRLPTLPELHTLVDEHRPPPAIATDYFDVRGGTLTWSGTGRGATGNLWVVDFTDGHTFFADSTTKASVRCVH